MFESKTITLLFNHVSLKKYTVELFCVINRRIEMLTMCVDYTREDIEDKILNLLLSPKGFKSICREAIEEYNYKHDAGKSETMRLDPWEQIKKKKKVSL
jgi:hypothetical protein